MNLKQSMEQGIKIVEAVERQEYMQFDLGDEYLEDAKDFAEALYMCHITKIDDNYPDVAPTYDVSYQGQALLVGCNIVELEDFLHRLIIKSNCKTLKVSQNHYTNYIHAGVTK